VVDWRLRAKRNAGDMAAHFCVNDDPIEVGRRSAAIKADSSSAACRSSMISAAITSGAGRLSMRGKGKEKSSPTSTTPVGRPAML
jgi:hypothetical protein